MPVEGRRTNRQTVRPVLRLVALMIATAAVVLAGCGASHSPHQLAFGRVMRFETVGRTNADVAFTLDVADFNRDGKPDVATTSESTNTVVVLVGNGDGTFRRPSHVQSCAGGAFILAQDLNGDGTVDLAEICPEGKVAVLLGKGNSTFGKATQYKVGSEFWWIASGDLNGDGWPDLVVADYGTGKLAVLLGGGKGHFKPAVRYFDLQCVSAVVADLNGDHKLDVATADYDGTVRVFPGKGK